MSRVERANTVGSFTEFKPCLWLPGGHAQTLWRKFSPTPEVSVQRQRLELNDGDFIDLDWYKPQPDGTQNRSRVLILHGLCGCSRSPYIQTLQHHLGGKGITSVAVNFRGCSGQINRLAKAYHSGITEDVQEIVEHLLSCDPDSPLALVGFSLGGNVLLKWLGETNLASSLLAAVAVSTPFRLELCSRAMLKGFGKYYGKYFLYRLVKDVESKKRHFEHINNQKQRQVLHSLGDLRSLKNLWEFDDRVTAPLHGFESAQDYYDRCSSINFLTKIPTPTLLIQSHDDPIIPRQAIPAADELNSNVFLDLISHGGHVGFRSSSDNRWLETRISDFIRHHGS